MKKFSNMMVLFFTFLIAVFFISCDLSQVTNQTPVSGDYIVENLNQTAGSVTAVRIMARDGKSPGRISVIYYAGEAAIPQRAGTYAVIFNVAAASGWNEALGLSAGNLIVTAASSGPNNGLDWGDPLSYVPAESGLRGTMWESTSNDYTISFSSDGNSVTTRAAANATYTNITYFRRSDGTQRVVVTRAFTATDGMFIAADGNTLTYGGRTFTKI